ncbi:hypothetical protein [Mycobacterium riyadhense]|uniref:Polyketide cyclase / dehydrase and lipid transport n=1 Tax=Mycobacterium riyadhense TaxID=486698 RepID=A0A1X2CWM0_9MYCO|nr:hypothetical protein [Mycobacterium riyadhense]MCV7145337.1 hypothetical protein [Mycobacterium riyadhense]ORW80325.1 hypothetical protein AWC22_17980 [Mycobacterium riyadhense]VTP00604.1 hypothetical protein BIN_B_03635 [Mycobacterium riyadhense]
MTTTDTHRTLIESALPTFDTVITEHMVVDADPATTFDAAKTLDLLTVRTPLVAVSFWVRSLPIRIFGTATPPVLRLVIGEGLGLPGWLLLGAHPDREVAFGAVGRFWRFWRPVIEWRDIPLNDFASFAEPGWAKIAANFSVRPYGEHSTLLSYECRTVTTDPESRRHFRRYWWLIRPFVGHIMRATLRRIKADAESTESTGRAGWA